jgi:flagellar basal-body rod modification protein FlgD
MAAAAGIFSHAMTAAQALTAKTASPLDSSTGTTGSTGSSSSSTGDSATISANDFLSLLVTEMQNQDPTADTDPNEYINQLVNVNSLEQLIGINQTLTGDLGPPPTTSAGGDPASATATGQPTPAAKASPGLPPGAVSHDRPSGFGELQSAGVPLAPASAARVPGNLSVPRASAASQGVARALDGHSHPYPVGGKLSGKRSAL